MDLNSFLLYLGHSPRGSTVYAGMDTSTGELVTVAEWELKWWHTNRKLDADDKDLYANEESKFMKQVRLHQDFL